MTTWKPKAMRLAGGLLLLSLASPTFAHGDDDLGAFLREGSCDAPGNIVEDIGDLDRDDDVWSVIGQGEPKPDVVWGEDEDIGQSIEALLTGEYVITVLAMDDVNADIIACGAVSGELESDGTLMIDLLEVNNSGFVGRAHFGPHADDDDEPTEVTTGAWRGVHATPQASPAASPAATATT